MPGTLATELAALPPFASLLPDETIFLPVDSTCLAVDSWLLVPNFSLVPPNMLTTSCWRARASSPMALNSPMLSGLDGMASLP